MSQQRLPDNQIVISRQPFKRHTQGLVILVLGDPPFNIRAGFEFAVPVTREIK